MRKSKLPLFAAGIVSLLAFATPDIASADAASRQRDLYRAAARAQDYRMNELQRHRAELRRDQAELERDRADLERLYRSGASRREILRKREEIRRNLGEIAQDHREISESLEALSRNRDRGYGWDNSGWQRDSWGRYDNTSWGWGRGYDRGRWGDHDRDHWRWRHGRD